MKLILKRTEGKKGFFATGGFTKYILVAKAELTPEEKEAVDHFNLERGVLFRSEANNETFTQYGSAGGNKIDLFTRLLAKRKTPEITVADLMRGLTFEDDYVVSMIDMQGSVIQAANTFDAMLKSVMGFLGEQVLDLPVV